MLNVDEITAEAERIMCAMRRHLEAIKRLQYIDRVVDSEAARNAVMLHADKLKALLPK